MATHSHILAWRIPWTEGPRRLRSIGSKSQNDWSNLAHRHNGSAPLAERWWCGSEDDANGEQGDGRTQEMQLQVSACQLLQLLRSIGRGQIEHLTRFCCCCSFSCVRLFVTPWTAARQASLFFANSNSCPLSQWCHPTILSSIVPFHSCLQSFPASGSFPMSQFFALGSKELVGSSCCISHSQESSPALQFKASILQLSAFFIVQLSHPYWLLEKP